MNVYCCILSDVCQESLHSQIGKVLSQNKFPNLRGMCSNFAKSSSFSIHVSYLTIVE